MRIPKAIAALLATKRFGTTGGPSAFDFHNNEVAHEDSSQSHHSGVLNSLLLSEPQLRQRGQPQPAWMDSEPHDPITEVVVRSASEPHSEDNQKKHTGLIDAMLGSTRGSRAHTQVGHTRTPEKPETDDDDKTGVDKRCDAPAADEDNSGFAKRCDKTDNERPSDNGDDNEGEDADKFAKRGNGDQPLSETNENHSTNLDEPVVYGKDVEDYGVSKETDAPKVTHGEDVHGDDTSEETDAPNVTHGEDVNGHDISKGTDAPKVTHGEDVHGDDTSDETDTPNVTHGEDVHGNDISQGVDHDTNEKPPEDPSPKGKGHAQSEAQEEAGDTTSDAPETPEVTEPPEATDGEGVDDDDTPYGADYDTNKKPHRYLHSGPITQTEFLHNLAFMWKKGKPNQLNNLFLHDMADLRGSMLRGMSLATNHKRTLFRRLRRKLLEAAVAVPGMPASMINSTLAGVGLTGWGYYTEEDREEAGVRKPAATKPIVSVHGTKPIESANATKPVVSVNATKPVVTNLTPEESQAFVDDYRYGLVTGWMEAIGDVIASAVDPKNETEPDETEPKETAAVVPFNQAATVHSSGIAKPAHPPRSTNWNSREAWNSRCKPPGWRCEGMTVVADPSKAALPAAAWSLRRLCVTLRWYNTRTSTRTYLSDAVYACEALPYLDDTEGQVLAKTDLILWITALKTLKLNAHHIGWGSPVKSEHAYQFAREVDNHLAIFLKAVNTGNAGYPSAVFNLEEQLRCTLRVVMKIAPIPYMDINRPPHSGHATKCDFQPKRRLMG